MNHGRTMLGYLREGLWTAYPFIVCMIAAMVFAMGWNDEVKGARIVATGIAGFSFIWAIDLAYARGKAKGESQTAAKIAALLTRGGDAEIIVTINRNGGAE